MNVTDAIAVLETFESIKRDLANAERKTEEGRRVARKHLVIADAIRVVLAELPK